MLKLTLLFTLLLSLHIPNIMAETAEPKTETDSEQSPRFAIHLLDYLAHDYAGAVAHGKITSASEYAEQKEFAARVLELANSLPEIKQDKKSLEKIIKLKTMIDMKAEAVDVALCARDIQKDLISLTKINLAPTRQPSISNGKILYEQSCVSCHGTAGRDGGKIPVLAGQAERMLIERMESLAAGDAQATIMSRLMRAYSKEEMAALARFFAQVKR